MVYMTLPVDENSEETKAMAAPLIMNIGSSVKGTPGVRSSSASREDGGKNNYLVEALQLTANKHVLPTLCTRWRHTSCFLNLPSPYITCPKRSENQCLPPICI
jgi:hypothetical protein